MTRNPDSSLPYVPYLDRTRQNIGNPFTEQNIADAPAPFGTTTGNTGRLIVHPWRWI
jgi:hypothetical protein